MLIQSAPADAEVRIIDGDDTVVARADLQRTGDYSPMTLIELDSSAMRRSEVWPDADLCGVPVLLAGGEVGVLQGCGRSAIAFGGSGRSVLQPHRPPPTTGAPPGGVSGA